MENQTQVEENIITPQTNIGTTFHKPNKKFAIVSTLILLILVVAIAWLADIRSKMGLSEEEKAQIINQITKEEIPINSIQREEMMKQIFNSN